MRSLDCTSNGIVEVGQSWDSLQQSFSNLSHQNKRLFIQNYPAKSVNRRWTILCDQLSSLGSLRETTLTMHLESGHLIYLGMSLSCLTISSGWLKAPKMADKQESRWVWVNSMRWDAVVDGAAVLVLTRKLFNVKTSIIGFDNTLPSVRNALLLNGHILSRVAKKSMQRSSICWR